MSKNDSPNISDKVEPFNKFQLCAIQLMYNDLKFLYTILNNQNIVTESYFVALLPYLGVIIDGVEDWINAYNNSSKYYKLNITYKQTKNTRLPKILSTAFINSAVQSEMFIIIYPPHKCIMNDEY